MLPDRSAITTSTLSTFRSPCSNSQGSMRRTKSSEQMSTKRRCATTFQQMMTNHVISNAPCRDHFNDDQWRFVRSSLAGAYPERLEHLVERWHALAMSGRSCQSTTGTIASAYAMASGPPNSPQAIVDGYIDQVIEAGSCDLVNDISGPFPMDVISTGQTSHAGRRIPEHGSFLTVGYGRPAGTYRPHLPRRQDPLNDVREDGSMQIHLDELTAGERLNRCQFGVSRMFEPHRGAFVEPVTAEAVADIYELYGHRQSRRAWRRTRSFVQDLETSCSNRSSLPADTSISSAALRRSDREVAGPA